MNDNRNKCTIAETIEDRDIYKVALDTRNFEISLFWQRSNYFLVLNSALAIGFFNLKSPAFGILLAALGILASFLWYRVNLGSKFWQCRWEHRLHEVERQIAPNANFFAADWSVVKSDVEKSLQFSEHKGFQLWLDQQVLKKPSVTYCMTMLSFIFMLGWFLVILLLLCGVKFHV